jgi:translation initiation factor IF-2
MAKIEIEDMITVGSLAEKLMIPVTRLITELMKNGVMATVNERIDFDTAQIIVGELGLEVELERKQVEAQKARTKPVASEVASVRPPVVAVMGHVDHGKTSLLDAIRSANVAKKEAGGITQHISAYQVSRGDRKITFLDTPGHEAFAALREHGAQLTDVAIIVIAADDGMKPQTIEAIRFARKAGVKILVAITKIDKEGADTNRIKQQMAEQNLLVEEWGGDTVVQEVSAKTGDGIDALLDMVLLIADVEELRADTNTPAKGLVIESHMEKGRGSVAVALIEAGTLKPSDFVVAGVSYAKVRNLESTTGEVLQSAGPSTPVVITGFKELPEFGDEFCVVSSEKDARKQVEQAQTQRAAGGMQGAMNSSELIRIINRSNELSELNIIIKADVQGSLTSVIDSLKALDTDEVAVRIVGSGVGTITENDVHLAHTTDAIIYGFHADLATSIKHIAARDKVKVRLYKVIYELIDDVKSELESLLQPKVVETEVGTLEVKGIFKTSKQEVICGGEVLTGKVSLPALVRVIRTDEVIGEAELSGVKRGPQEAKEVFGGEMCGLSLKTTGKLDLAEGDKLQFYTTEIVARTL